MLEKIRTKIEDNLAENAALAALAERLGPDGAEVERADVSLCGSFLDINSPTRKDTETLIPILQGGKWIKSKSGVTNRLDYTTESEWLPGLILRLWASDPPGTCRMVKKEVFIPAQPERTEVIEELVCTPEEPEGVTA